MSGERASELVPGVVRIVAPLPFSKPPSINCYAIDTPQGEVLIDTGMIGSESALDAGLAAAGAQPRQVMVTHGHPDHFGLAGRYGDIVHVHPHAYEQATMSFSPTMNGALSGRVVDLDGLRPMLELIKKMTVPLPARSDMNEGDRLGEWEAILTPGHAPGHLCLYRERDGVLIAGDHLLPDVTPNLNATDHMPDPVSDFLASLERVAKLDISLVLPAHGEPFADAPGRAAELIAHHERRLGQLVEALDGGPQTEEALTSLLFGRLENEDAVMAHMEAHAHLVHLQLAGRVIAREPGVWSLSSNGNP